jgi:hypothetical protein
MLTRRLFSLAAPALILTPGVVMPVKPFSREHIVFTDEYHYQPVTLYHTDTGIMGHLTFETWYRRVYVKRVYSEDMRRLIKREVISEGPTLPFKDQYIKENWRMHGGVYVPRSS